MASASVLPAVSYNPFGSSVNGGLYGNTQPYYGGVTYRTPTLNTSNTLTGINPSSISTVGVNRDYMPTPFPINPTASYRKTPPINSGSAITETKVVVKEEPKSVTTTTTTTVVSAETKGSKLTWFGWMLVWFVVFLTLFWLLEYSLQPTWVLGPDGTVDLARVFLSSFIFAAILIIIAYVFKIFYRKYTRC